MDSTIKAKGHIILGVSKRTVERDLEGRYTISGERIEKWAKLLRCKTSVLFHKGVTDIKLSTSIKKMGLIR